MERIARVIVAHSKPILAATALISLIAVAMLFRMQFNADISSFALTGSEAGEAFVELQEKYDTADPINVVVTLAGRRDLPIEGGPRYARRTARSDPRG